MESFQKRLKEITHDLADSPLPPKRIKLREEERYILKMINNSHEMATAAAELKSAEAKLASTKTNVDTILSNLQREKYHEHVVCLETLCAIVAQEFVTCQKRVAELKKEKDDINEEWQESRAIESTMGHSAGQR
jgi:uncharacterized coiled-coil DUF342 family protein